jgi:heat shock protein HslJ
MRNRLKIKKQLILFLILSVGIFTCSTQQETLAGDETKVSTANSITEKYWKLVELNGLKIVRSKNQTKEPYFILKLKDNRVIGHGGCNSFGGTYELQGVNKIKFSKIVSTMMACIDSSDMEIESQLFRVLEMADNYYINVDTLQLNRARMAPLAKFEAVYLK